MRPSVLQLIGSFHQGGSERQALQLTRLLKESGRYEVYLAAMDRSGPLLGEASDLGFDDIPEYRLTSFYDRTVLTEVRRLAHFLRARRIGVVQTHDFYTNVFGMAAARLAGVPVRIAARRETTGWRTPAQKAVERMMYRFAHTIVGNSQGVRRQLLAEGVPDRKIATIYNGIDFARLALPADFDREKALGELGLPSRADLRFVTIVANLRHAVKDHPTFLRAARRVSLACPDARFVIAGEGELTEPMREMAARLGIASETAFVGQTGRIAELLAVSEVCVLSSTAEGFSNAILEYLAASRPVVVTDVGGAREAVAEGETGHIVPPGDDAAMAARIIALLGSPDRAREMGQAGRQTAERNFSCAAQLGATEALYERLLAVRGRGRARKVVGVRRGVA